MERKKSFTETTQDAELRTHLSLGCLTSERIGHQGPVGKGHPVHACIYKGKAIPSRERRKTNWETSQPLGRETKHRGAGRGRCLCEERDGGKAEKGGGQKGREESLGVDNNSRYFSP